MFEVRLKKSEQTIKKKIATAKVKSIFIFKGIAFSTDTVNLAITFNFDILFLEFDGTPLLNYLKVKG